jgi:glucose/arabinose dehydrogenase
VEEFWPFAECFCRFFQAGRRRFESGRPLATKPFPWLVGLLVGLVPPATASGQSARPLLTGLKNPTSVAAGTDGKVYLTVSGAAGKEGDGAVLVVAKDKAVPFATGLDAPGGLTSYLEWLFVADGRRIWRVDRRGKAEVFVPATAFPSPPRSLHDITADPESGLLYVSDAGDGKGRGAVYRIGPKSKVEPVIDAAKGPGPHSPRGLLLDGASHLLIADFGTGSLHRVKLADGSSVKLADGLGGADRLAWDKHGRLFVSDRTGGRLFVIPRPGDKPVRLADGTHAAAICLDPAGKALLVLDAKAGTLTALPVTTPGAPVDETPTGLETAVAFPGLQWTGWQAESDKGRITPLRPIVLTHAGDGSNRVFVATQHGVIHVFPNDQKATRTQVFLDLHDRVTYDDNQNEEGFLGLAFHPDYKKTGEFFVFYTTRKAKGTNLLSRFRVRGDDPNRADPASEEVLLRIERPFWNHDGGTLCFGPDGYLYVAVGDGGSANDPFDNGQNLNTLLGKVLRLDVDHKDAGRNYAVPRDNPFAGRKDARPEVWAYGLRNVWRMAFDRKTGRLWAGDVGQNLYEEIDILRAGGNYGWNRREGLHPFGVKGLGPRKGLIDPVWEYHHDVGKCIIGGLVYRGPRLPQLEGAYLYGDYVTGRLWALRYEEAGQRVVANRPIRDRNLPMLSFGEDEKGEVYFLTTTVTGQGIYWFAKAGSAPGR